MRYRVCLWSQEVGSHLCLHSQLVGNLQLSQLQCQLKPVLRVCGYSQGLLFETLNRHRKKTAFYEPQKCIKIKPPLTT